ncbi:2-succinyl-6-hydroxy-2,4-cyclohexadiene-1-carboxylate synthase [Bacillus songklensis]|uniref:Putative 2-succinyl-6-hydroxy-2,4-cyclohexadiene-1-carboxylate synthase n=1 Tax=Bacillus songklensis TaxID=1069116 RepID=A0ABV8B5X1_9BACI
MKFVIHDVSYHVYISGEGSPLLLLHGFTGSKETWEPFYGEWEKTGQLISLDIIGHGETSSPQDVTRYGMESVVQDLRLLLDELHIEQINVLGYSMGGRLALSFAAMFPERVGKLILESASPGLKTVQERERRKQQDDALAQQILDNGISWFVDKWGNIPLFESQKQLPSGVQQSMREQRLKNDPIGLANSLRGMGTGMQPSWWGKLPFLQMPTLLVTGEWDEKFCRIAREMENLMPHAKHETILNAGHAIHVEQREIFGKIVSGFLANEKG